MHFIKPLLFLISLLLTSTTASAQVNQFDYLLKRVGFNPDIHLKQIGDALYQQKLIREQIQSQTGRRFLIGNTNDDSQYQKLMDNAIAQQQDLELIPGITLTQAQIKRLTSDMVWLESQTITLTDGSIQEVLVPRVYLANPKSYTIKDGMLIAGGDINLKLDNLNNAGLLQAGDSISISALNQITNQGGDINATNNINLLANNNINNISANIKAKNINLLSIKGDINNKRFEQAVDYSKKITKNNKTIVNNFFDNTTSLQNKNIDTKKLIGNQAGIIATNNLRIVAQDKINIQGSNLKAKNINLDAKNINLTTTTQKTNFYSGNSKNYLQESSTTNLGSSIKAGNININASEQTNIKGSSIQADNQINIQSKILDIASVKDTQFSKSHSESKGGLFGGGHNDTTTKQTTTNKGSNLNAKSININTQVTQITASKINAETLKLTTDLLNLVSDKDLDFKQIKTDSSGLLTRKITDKGHNTEAIIDAKLQAQNLVINGVQITNTNSLSKATSPKSSSAILKAKLNALSSQSFSGNNDNTNNQTGIQISAELQQQLKAKGINLYDLTSNNKNWDESTTTLSGLGKIIVQVAVGAMTGGAGTGFVNAALASVQNQILSAMLTSAITGERMNLNPKQMLKAAITAGASQYALSKYGTANYNAKSSYGTNLQNGLQNSAITTGVSTAINGGSLANNLKGNLAGSVLDTSLAKGANFLGDSKTNLGEVGHKLSHGALGCVGAKISGGDCASGAVGAVVGEVIAEQVGKNSNLSDEAVKDISRIGTAVVAQGLGKDVEVADKMGGNAVENNFIIHAPGTFSSKKDVDKAFKKGLKEFYNDKNLIVIDNNKELANNKEAREELANKIVDKIMQIKKDNPNEPIRLTGHSHGGNVQKLVTQKLVEQGSKNIVDDIMFLATPVRDDYKLANPVLKDGARVLNVYDDSDLVQSPLGGIDNTGLNPFSDYKNFPAKQIMDNNSRVTNIEIEVPNKIDIHNFINPVGKFINDEVYGDHVDMDSKEALDEVQKKLNE